MTASPPVGATVVVGGETWTYGPSADSTRNLWRYRGGYTFDPACFTALWHAERALAEATALIESLDLHDPEDRERVAAWVAARRKEATP